MRGTCGFLLFQFVWSYKYNLTRDIRFDSAAHDVCEVDLKVQKDCNAQPRGEGKVR